MGENLFFDYTMTYEDGRITFKLYNKKGCDLTDKQNELKHQKLSDQQYFQDEYKTNQSVSANLTKRDIDSMIDIALQLGDKVWFYELVNMRNGLVRH